MAGPKEMPEILIRALTAAAYEACGGDVKKIASKIDKWMDVAIAGHVTDERARLASSTAHA